MLGSVKISMHPPKVSNPEGCSALCGGVDNNNKWLKDGEVAVVNGEGGGEGDVGEQEQNILMMRGVVLAINVEISVVYDFFAVPWQAEVSTYN